MHGSESEMNDGRAQTPGQTFITVHFAADVPVRYGPVWIRSAQRTKNYCNLEITAIINFARKTPRA
jgi:hypothetical protein